MRISSKSSALLLPLLLASSMARAADVEVVGGDADVRSAPFAVAPVMARVHAGDKLTGGADAQPGWLHVSLPDGRRGFLLTGQARVTGAPETDPAAAALSPAPPPPPPSSSSFGPSLLGFTFELVPDGTLKRSGNGPDMRADLAATSALGLFLDVPVWRGVQIGASSRVVLKVRGTAASDSGTEIDLRARVSGCRPLSSRASVCLRFSPGYAVLALPSSQLPNQASSPSGLTLDAAAGGQVALLPDLELVFDAGYQWSFLDTSVAGVRVDVRLDSLHAGVGFALRL